MAWLGTKTFSSSSIYEHSELNRVNENVAYLRDQLNYYGYNVVLAYPVKTTYAMSDIVYRADINNVRANILNMKAKFTPNMSAPDISVDQTRIQVFDYAKANAIEVNLLTMYTLLLSAIQSFKYCGTFYAGQDVIL